MLSDQDKILIKKKFVFERVHSEDVDRRGVNKLLKKLHNIGTGGQAVADPQCPHSRKC